MIEIKQVKLSELIENPKNPRKMLKSEMDKLIRSIKDFGLVDPLIVNSNPSRKNIIVGGHQRAIAAKKIGMDIVPVVYVNMKEEEEQLLNVALNGISGEFDEHKLFLMLSELETKGRFNEERILPKDNER